MKTKKESKSKSGKGKVQGQIQPVTLFSKAESQAALDLFDAEVLDRHAKFATLIQRKLASLRAQFEDELAALPPQLAHLTAGEFIRTYGANLDRALQDVDREKRERVEREERERWDEQVERTVKKRKRIPNTSTTTAESALEQASPTKQPARKNAKLASASASPTKASAGASKPSQTQRTVSSSQPSAVRNPFRSESRAASTSSYRPPPLSRQSTATSVGASRDVNFVYRARPSTSAFPNMRGGVVPQTPSLRPASAVPGTVGLQGTAARVPRRGEAIQAYSLNGSPLGVMDSKDLPQSEGMSLPATSESEDPNDEGRGSGVVEEEEDWELLERARKTSNNSNNSAISSKGRPAPSSTFTFASSATAGSGGKGGGGDWATLIDMLKRNLQEMDLTELDRRRLEEKIENLTKLSA